MGFKQLVFIDKGLLRCEFVYSGISAVLQQHSFIILPIHHQVWCQLPPQNGKIIFFFVF